jgi:uncharacterized protein YhfF/RimJ/RimL family protein N-acetyltransferase
MRTLVTDRLRLEPQVAAHAAQMFVVLSDPAIYEYENAPPQSETGLRERFAELESRRSPNGREQWLNWVIREPDAQLIGYVQATVYPGGRAAIAYELGSAWWGRGFARQAVEAMLGELGERYGVRELSAVLKQENLRSLRLLERLGFAMASPAEHARREVERDEHLMLREIVGPASLPAVLARLRALGVELPPGPVRVDGYGDSPELSEALLALIRAGRKRAGTGLLWAMEADHDSMPQPGQLEIVIDHRNEPALITRLTQVQVLPYGKVTAGYAAIEGEGDGSLEYWREAHWSFFSRECRRIGREPSESMPVVCSVFELLAIVAPPDRR